MLINFDRVLFAKEIDCRKVGIKISNDMKIILFEGGGKLIVCVKFSQNFLIFESWTSLTDHDILKSTLPSRMDL